MDPAVSNLMNTNAKKLKQNNHTTTRLHSEILKLLREIEIDIREKHATKIRSTSFAMPVNFDIVNMSNAESQRVIYSSIIDQLKLNSYDVRLVYGQTVAGKTCALEISWISDQDVSETERQNRVILTALSTQINRDKV